MRSSTLQKALIDGPAGKLELAINDPGSSRVGIALIAHPHPLRGGTLDNKVVQTLAKAFFGLGYYCVRPNFRGVGESEGSFGEGIGETEDLLAAAQFAKRQADDLPFVLSGFLLARSYRPVCASVSPPASWCWSAPRSAASRWAMCPPTPW